ADPARRGTTFPQAQGPAPSHPGRAQAPTSPSPSAAGRLAARGHGADRMIGGLLLALTSAALINIGFLLQHRGLRRTGGGGILGQLWRALHDPVWLSGQALGWAGFIAQVVAVAVAPLSLVQAFAAGGLALSVPVAAWM